MDQKGFVNILVIISIIVVAGIVGYFLISRKPVTTYAPIPSQSKAPENKGIAPTVNPTNLPLKNVGYDLERLSNDFSSPQYFDARLIATNDVGKKEILVSSIKTAIPELQKDFNRTLVILSISEDNTKIFLKEILDATDAPPFAIFSFDVNSKKFTKLLLSTADIRYFLELSSNKQFVAGVFADDKQEVVYIFDLLLNKKVSTFIMPTTETVFAGRGLDGGEYLKWINEKILEYTVYDKTQFVDGYKYIGTRRLVLP